MAVLTNEWLSIGLLNYTDDIVPYTNSNFHMYVVRPSVEFPDIKARRFGVRRHLAEVLVRKEEMNRQGDRRNE